MGDRRVRYLYALLEKGVFMVDKLYVDGEFGTHVDSEGHRITPIRSGLIGQIGVAAREKFAEDMEKGLDQAIRKGIERNLPAALSFLEQCSLDLAQWFLPEGYKIIDTAPLRKIEEFKKEVIRLWSEYEPQDGRGKPMLLHLSIEEDTTEGEDN